jgi:hypothetical protein
MILPVHLPRSSNPFKETTMRRFIFATFALTVLAACQPPADEDTNPLIGAWQVTEMTTTSPDSSYTINDPQPGLYIFTEGHYSMMYVPAGEPRPLDAGDVPILGALIPTDAEKIASWETFIANSGSYAISGSTLTTRPMVAKSANLMAAGSPLTMTYQVMGDTLLVSFAAQWTPEIELRTTLTRIR